MVEPTDITVQILTSIRDELRALNGRVDGLNDRVDGLNDRVDGLNGRVDGLSDRFEQLHHRQVETEIRLATELVANRGTMHQIVDLLREQLELRPVVNDHEERLKKLEAHVKLQS